MKTTEDFMDRRKITKGEGNWYSLWVHVYPAQNSEKERDLKIIVQLVMRDCQVSVL